MKTNGPKKKKAYYDLCPVPFKMKAHWDGMGFFSPFSTLCMLCLSFQGLAFTHFTSKSWALWMGNLMKRKMSWHFSLYISQGNERIFTLKCWRQLNSFFCLDKTVSGIPHWWKIRQKGLNIFVYLNKCFLKEIGISNHIFTRKLVKIEHLV